MAPEANSGWGPRYPAGSEQVPVLHSIKRRVQQGSKEVTNSSRFSITSAAAPGTSEVFAIGTSTRTTFETLKYWRRTRTRAGACFVLVALLADGSAKKDVLTHVLLYSPGPQ